MDKTKRERNAFSQDKLGPTSLQSSWVRLGTLILVIVLMQCFWSAIYYYRWSRQIPLLLDDFCPQVAAITSVEHEALLNSLDEEFGSSEFKLKAYESLGGAIRIPTESYDDFELPSSDSQGSVMTKFHEYLESRFPKVHANLKRVKVNTYALVYEWKGTENVKPLLIAAHMDVVPVNPDTYDDWVHPPYSGHYDGEWIWGRGSVDFKPGVIGSLTAIEMLLERGFVPSRTVLLAFGMDEEVGGHEGAAKIAQYLLETYGLDSMAMIVDEGGRSTNRSGTIFALPAVTEKTYMNIRMDVLTPGGHSSTPPKHTGIGILADLVTKLEAHTLQPELVRGSTYHQGLECRAKYDTGFPESLTQLLLQSHTSDTKLRELGDRLMNFDPLYYVESGTTQAIDLIGGGVKVNALPEIAWAVANNRIATHNSLAEVMAHYTNIALAVAAKHNMSLEAFGGKVGSQDPSWGTIRLYNPSNYAVVSTPVTPTKGSGPWELFSGTIRSVSETHLRTDSLPKFVVVSPGITRNTDTRYYFNLTQHIFRYNYLGHDDIYNRVHTINEAVRAEGFLEQIRFFARLVLNADQSDLLE